jgi:hypothetical protein
LLFIIPLTVSCNPNKVSISTLPYNGLDSIEFQKIGDTKIYWKYSYYILQYPDSKLFEKALENYYSSREQYWDSAGIAITDCFNNCASIKLTPNQEILYEHEKINIESLTDSLLKFLLNEDDSELLSEKLMTEDAYGRQQAVSRGFIQIEYIFDSCLMLQPIVKNIHNSYSLYRNHLAEEWYHKSIDKLDSIELSDLYSKTAYRVQFVGLEEEYIIEDAPPSPTFEEILEIVEDKIENENAP